MQEINYRGYNLKTDSYLDDETEKWVPRVFITPVDATPIKEMPLTWNKEFDNLQGADDFALEGAQFYIDNHY